MDGEICEVLADEGFRYAAFEIEVYEEEKDITLEAEDELAVTIYVQRT